MWKLGASSKKIYERIRSRYGTPAIGQGQYTAARPVRLRFGPGTNRIGVVEKGNDKATGVVVEHIFSISFYMRYKEREIERVKPSTHSYICYSFRLFYFF